MISTVGGTGAKESTREGESLMGNPLNGPRALAVKGKTGWLALREGNAIYRIDLQTQRIQRAAGTGAQGFTGNDGPALQATLSGPKGITVDNRGFVIWADTESHSIRYLDPATSTVHLLVGTGKRGDGKEGDPLTCELSRPHGVFADRNGNLWIGDSENHRIRRLSLNR